MNDSTINNLANESFYIQNSSDSNQTNSSNFKFIYNQNSTPGSIVGKHENATVLHEEDLSKLNDLQDQQKLKDSNKDTETSKPENSNTQDEDIEKNTPDVTQLQQPCLSGSIAPECVRAPINDGIVQQGDEQNSDEKEVCDNENDDDGDGLVDAEDIESCPKSVPSGPQGCPPGYHEDAVEPICILGEKNIKEICSNEKDDDGNGLVDAEDIESCPNDPSSGEEPTTEGFPVGELPPLSSIPELSIPPGDFGLPLLPEETITGLEVCDNAIDDDGNGLVDMEDIEQCSMLTSANETLGEQSEQTFLAGRVNTLIDATSGKWIVNGDWNFNINAENVTSFNSNMTWYNSTGSNEHTHQLTNFRSSIIGEPLSLESKNNVTVMKGVIDIGTDNKILWFGVPTMISINDGKIITISIDDNKTDHHFGAQPLLGLVNPVSPYSDLSALNSENASGSNIEVPVQTKQFEDKSEDSLPLHGSVSAKETLPLKDLRAAGKEETQTGRNEQNFSSDPNPSCSNLNIVDISANGFETDPSDYHPPSDAIDGSSDTWWSHNSDDPWVVIDLSEPYYICGISVDWNKGEKRDYSFQIEISKDGNSYHEVFEGNNRRTTDVENYHFNANTLGQFVKLKVIDTSSKSGWVSIREINAFGLPNQ